MSLQICRSGTEIEFADIAEIRIENQAREDD